MNNEIFEPYSEEWRKEMMKLSKNQLIDLFIKGQTGTSDRKIAIMHSKEDAMRTVEGIINDFESGIIDKDETFGLFGEYTARIMHIFWNKAVERIRENPSLLNEKLTPIP